MSYIFGPVPSRRFGLSLGIDLIPQKTCSFDCVYCQVGRTTDNIIEPASFVPVTEVINELKQVLTKTPPDVITLAGSGEPTLNCDIGTVIAEIKKLTSTPLTLLTNGSLLWDKNVREKVTGVDFMIPTLSSVYEDTFRKIHRPHLDLKLENIIQGLKEIRGEYKKDLFLEAVIIAGLNDTDKEISGLSKVIKEIKPEKVQLNTVVRPPSDPEAKSVSNAKLEEIKNFLGDNAEIIAHTPLKARESSLDSKVDHLMEMIKRRPLTVDDIQKTLSMSKDDTERLVKELKIKGQIQEQEQGGSLYYSPK